MRAGFTANRESCKQILAFYMGKNASERKHYIVENLVVTMEERCLRTVTGRTISASPTLF